MSSKNNKKKTEEPVKEVPEVLLQIRKEGFIKAPIAGDGDCFFNSLRLYFILYNNPLKLKSIIELRASLVNYMIDHVDDLIPIFNVHSNKVSNKNVGLLSTKITPEKREKVINELKRYLVPGSWASLVGDFGPTQAAIVFNINIDIYNWNGSRLVYNRSLDYNPGRATISLLRVGDNHYNLLIPISDYVNPETKVKERYADMLTKTTEAKEKEAKEKKGK
jgi:hypothetical protein